MGFRQYIFSVSNPREAKRRQIHSIIKLGQKISSLRLQFLLKQEKFSFSIYYGSRHGNIKQIYLTIEKRLVKANMRTFCTIIEAQRPKLLKKKKNLNIWEIKFSICFKFQTYRSKTRNKFFKNTKLEIFIIFKMFIFFY